MLARLLIIYFSMLTVPVIALKGFNPLSGQHLHVLGMEFPAAFTTRRNVTGHIVHFEGPLVEMIEALSIMMNFTYSYLPFTVSFTDDMPFAKGGIFYLNNGEADYFLSSSLGTGPRTQKADFPANWFHGPFSTLMPYPQETINLTASFAPLSYMVWILIGVATVTTFLFLQFLQRMKTRQAKSNNQTRAEDMKSKYQESVLLYVMGNLVSQGQRNFPKKLAVRIAAGAWCCACFFLVQIYCCTLTSHLTSQNQKPLVNSFFEIADTPGVTLTIDRGLGVDVLLQQSIQSSSRLKRFADILNKENRLITCNTTANCLKNVISGNAVYCAPINPLSIIMAADVNGTGPCHYTRTKETFWSSPVFNLLPKNSPYTESMSIGILRLREMGLLAEFDKRNVPSASKCLKVNERKGMPRLSLKHLSSPFVILVAGYLISLFVFIIEIILGKNRYFNRPVGAVVVIN